LSLLREWNSPRRGDDTRSEYVARLADGAFGEAREAERRDVERRLAVHDQLRGQASRDRPHREAVPAEAGGEDESREAGDLAEHRREVRGGVDVARPSRRDPERRQGGQEAPELGQAPRHLGGIRLRLDPAVPVEGVTAAGRTGQRGNEAPEERPPDVK